MEGRFVPGALNGFKHLHDRFASRLTGTERSA